MTLGRLLMYVIMTVIVVGCFTAGVIFLFGLNGSSSGGNPMGNIEELTQTHEELTAELNQAQVELSDMRLTLAHEEGHLEALQRQIKTMTDTNAEILNDLRTEIQTHTRTSEELQYAFNAAGNIGIEERLGMQAEISAAEARVEVATNHYQNAVNRFRASTESLEHDIRTLDAQVSSLLDTHVQLQAEIDYLKAEIERDEAELEGLHRRIAVAVGGIAELEEGISTLQREVDGRRERHQELRDGVAQAENRLLDAIAQREELQQNLQRLTEEATD